VNPIYLNKLEQIHLFRLNPSEQDLLSPLGALRSARCYTAASISESAMASYRASCHCGAVTATFATEAVPASLEVRSCACGFCRRHGAMTVSDPAGTLEVGAIGGRGLRYRFGLGITDFVVCAACGCYVAALMDDSDGTWGIVNVRMMEPPVPFTTPAVPRDYGAEDAAGRRLRRRALWTPVTAVSLA